MPPAVNKKISALTTDAAPALEDLVPTVDVSDTTDGPAGSSKKITLTLLKALIVDPAAALLLPKADNLASLASKDASVANLFAGITGWVTAAWTDIANGTSVQAFVNRAGAALNLVMGSGTNGYALMRRAGATVWDSVTAADVTGLTFSATKDLAQYGNVAGSFARVTGAYTTVQTDANRVVPLGTGTNTITFAANTLVTNLGLTSGQVAEFTFEKVGTGTHTISISGETTKTLMNGCADYVIVGNQSMVLFLDWSGNVTAYGKGAA
jgi:hypothetical protein